MLATLIVTLTKNSGTDILQKLDKISALWHFYRWLFLRLARYTTYILWKYFIWIPRKLPAWSDLSAENSFKSCKNLSFQNSKQPGKAKHQIYLYISCQENFNWKWSIFLQRTTNVCIKVLIPTGGSTVPENPTAWLAENSSRSRPHSTQNTTTRSGHQLNSNL